MFTSSPSLKMEAIGCLFSRRSLSAFPILPPRSRRRPFQSPSLVPLMMSSSPSSAQVKLTHISFSVGTHLFFPLPDGGFGDRSGGKEAYKGPRPRRDLVGDWVSNNNGLVRSLPIYVGGLSLLVVLLNRAFSGIALVTDASRYRSFYFVNECLISFCVFLFSVLVILLRSVMYGILVMRIMLNSHVKKNSAD